MAPETAKEANCKITALIAPPEAIYGPSPIGDVQGTAIPTNFDARPNFIPQ